ncbi:MAG: hypothetical protein WCF23_23355 [Candidatus Nitrosopolaris sp.]
MREEEDDKESLSQKLLLRVWRLVANQEYEIHQLRQKIQDIKYGALLE